MFPTCDKCGNDSANHRGQDHPFMSRCIYVEPGSDCQCGGWKGGVHHKRVEPESLAAEFERLTVGTTLAPWCSHTLWSALRYMDKNFDPCEEQECVDAGACNLCQHDALFVKFCGDNSDRIARGLRLLDFLDKPTEELRTRLWQYHGESIGGDEMSNAIAALLEAAK